MSEIIQGSPEWFAIKRGKVSASRICDVNAKTKSGWGASRANYMSQLIAERLTGETQETYQNDAMRWGIEKEPDARAAYEFRNDVNVGLVAFIDHPKIPMSGASPDGLVDAFGLVEIKCPGTTAHIETLECKSVPSKYIPQIQWQLSCSGREWCDFVSYDPRMPESMRLFVQRVMRDNIHISTLETDVRSFLAELEEKIYNLTRLYT
jgi:putative phage-type endonuclease